MPKFNIPGTDLQSLTSTITRQRHSALQTGTGTWHLQTQTHGTEYRHRNGTPNFSRRLILTGTGTKTRHRHRHPALYSPVDSDRHRHRHPAPLTGTGIRHLLKPAP